MNIPLTIDDFAAIARPYNDKLIAEHTITRIRKAATKWPRCCDQWQDAFGMRACRDCEQKTFAMLREIQTILGLGDHETKGGGAVIVEGTPPDPRDPDPSRPGIFRDHNCWACKDGTQPCREGKPGGSGCSNPHARND